MTSWAEGRRDADAEWRMERVRDERVQCPWCHQSVGETCWNRVTGSPLARVPAHWQRMFAAAHGQEHRAVTADWKAALEDARRAREVTAEQSVWDGHWNRWLDIARRAGRGWLQSIAIAYTRTEDQYGKRPNRQEAK